jgi:hypothetical protein
MLFSMSENICIYDMPLLHSFKFPRLSCKFILPLSLKALRGKKVDG